LAASTPAFITSIILGHQDQVELRGFGNGLAVFAKASLSPLTSLTATSSGRRFNPTRSYWNAFQTLSLAPDRPRQYPKNLCGQRSGCKRFFHGGTNGFTAYRAGPHTFADFDRANGRRRSFGQLFPGLIRYIRATVQLGLAGSQIHGKARQVGTPHSLQLVFGRSLKI
jgi:hypothetical protein